MNADYGDWIVRSYSCPDDHDPAVYSFSHREGAESFIAASKRMYPTDIFEITDPDGEVVA